MSSCKPKARLSMAKEHHTYHEASFELPSSGIARNPFKFSTWNSKDMESGGMRTGQSGPVLGRPGDAGEILRAANKKGAGLGGKEHRKDKECAVLDGCS